MASLFRFLIRSLISLAFLTTVTAAGKHEPFFMNVELSDAYTGTTNCTDKNHWFLITADVFLPQGSSDDIYMTVPDDLGSLPNGSFSLKYNSKAMGSVFINGSNVLKISPEGKAASNVTASFDFLAQLTTDAKKQIQSPGKIDYTFEVSTGSDFTTSINYVAQDLQALTSNGGFDANDSTAWFTADIPLSMLNRPLYFTSQEAANTTYQFNTTLTSAEIVVAVDAFNQPTRSFSFSAFKDLSDSSQIKLLFNTTINGGKYIRVNFFTNVLNTASIGNTVSLDYANQLSKRNAITVTSNLYSTSQSNVQNQDSDESSNNSASSTATQETYETYYLESTTEPGVYTEIGTWIPVSTLSSQISTTSATSSVLDSLNSISSPSISTSFVSSTPVTTSLLTANSSTSYTATKTKAAPGKLLLGSKSNSSEEYLTYSVITTTINGEVITLTSLTPISTLSSVMPSTQGFYLNKTTSSQSTFLTAAEDSIITKSKSALPSDSATLTSSSAISSSLQTKLNNSTTTLTESHGTTTIASSKSTSVEVDSYKTYAVITKDDSGAFTTYTSVRALSTLSSSSVPASSQVVVTKDKGDFTTYASGFPLTTLNSGSASSANIMTSSSRDTFTKDDSESFTSNSKSPIAPTTTPSSASAINSRVASSTVITNSVMNSTSSLWIQTQLTSTGDLQTSHSVLMYQDGGARASAGFGGLLVSFVLLWIL